MWSFRVKKSPAGRAGRRPVWAGFNRRRAERLPGGGQFGGEKRAALGEDRDLLSQFDDIGG
ncbi:MAG: hypothetical protein A3D16_02830 [Rhodobacterales bacterium RIFCSPHIGHO2_02_FULL_62_130]|nr:MAG: hypothetical protein A3D16_02830 [Rhodobacterales bacterium RIFCSPHIGHO2_02_FULL_62_130]OHC55704.1 MAG: hypothetical protein A3E48_10085 [Rhodobacterales bacterium RIFCSPHIGHO2_12_FULL_62_75]